MSWTRNAVYDALLAKLQASTALTAICPASNITRRLAPDPRSPEAATPYLAIVEIGEETAESKGDPALDTLDARLIGGLRPGIQADQVKSQDINDFLDAIRGALAPDPVTGFQTLGGLVSHCWVEGRTGIEEGLALANPSLVEVPVRILVGQDNDASGRQFVFDVGTMFATLTGRDGDQAAPAVPTVVRFGDLKEGRITGETDLVFARSGQVHQVQAARKGVRVGVAARFASVDALVANQLMFAEDAAAGALLVAMDEAHTVPAVGPYTVMIAPPSAGVYDADLGVAYAATGAYGVRVAAGPAAGQFSLAGAVYTFASADAGLAVRISYSYTVTGGKSVTVTNRPGGIAPTFRLVMAGRYNGRQMVVIFNRCVTEMLVVPEMLERFMIADFKIQVLADTDGNVGRWSLL